MPIQSEAYMSNPLAFTVGDTIPCTLVNTGNYYVQLLLYINGTLIKTVNAGQVTSYTIDPTSAEDDAIYAVIPNKVFGTAIVRVKTFSDSSYTTQIGSDKDKTGYASININLVRPIFTNWEFTNTDEVIVNKDKYDNTLTTSNTNTLTNATDICISGFNKPTATISVANKAIAQKGATMLTYNFELAGKLQTGAYSDTNPVVLSIDDITQLSPAFVVAVDSRSITKSVRKTFSFLTYSPVTLYGIVLTRDNDVDSATKLAFSGTSFKGFFDLNNGGDGGAENVITCHYRYKLTTENWGSQAWTEITATIGSNGEISFDDYIDGDLGTSGFDTEKSYNIEVRAYDLLTNSIVEETLSKGTPIIDITQDGVAIKAKYDSTEGGSLQVDGKNIFKSSVLITGQTEDTTPSGLDYLLTYDTSATGLKKASLGNITGIGSYNGFSRNCIINGNFEIWQRAESGTITEATLLRTQDRWFDYATANGGTLPTLSRSKETLSSGELPNSFYYTRLTTNGAGTSLGNSAYHIFAQNIEHALRLFGGQKVTLSFYARSSIANKKIGAYLTSSWGTGGSPSSAVITSGDAFGLTSDWTKCSYTFTLPSNDGKTFGTNNNDRVRLEILYMWGSNIASQFGETNAETYGGSGTIDITQVQLSLGDALLPFSPRSYQEEFLLCARYCYVPSTPTSLSIIGQGTCALSTIARIIIPTPVPMYAVPTVSATYSDWIVSDEINSTTVTDIDPIAELTTNYNPVLAFATAGGLTQFRPVMIRSNGANKKLILSAEI